ncbi:MAG: tetratricopeptide repeat protein [Chloroherpetonaceae bacterium]|nr:tetratricopeptide repeat protein [Chloroherpetonaceae bacterium]
MGSTIRRRATPPGAPILALLLLAGCRPALTVAPERPNATVTPASQDTARVSRRAPDPDPRVADIRAALNAQDYPRALQLCRAARNRGVPLPLILEQEAEIYRATRYLDRELDTLIAWCRAAPKDPRPWYRRFFLYIQMGWRREAEQASARAFQLAPDDARSYVTRAILHYRSNEPALGLPDVEKARQLAPNNPEYLNLHATILMKDGQVGRAEAVLRDLVARAPQEPRHRILLAQALARNRKPDEAEALLRALQSEVPDSVEIAYELGLMAEKRGDLVEAARQLERAAALDPGYGNVLFCLGRVAIKQGRAGEGRALQKRFQVMDSRATTFETTLNRLRTRPNDPELHRQLARIYLADNELPQAILELRRVLQLRPHDTQACRELITALQRHGRITEARQLARALPSP